MTTPAVAVPLPKRIPVDGRPIKARLVQTLVWGVAVGTASTWVIAAIYYLTVELRYGPFWLKPGWDGLFSQTWWDPVRHDIRDVYEGVLATIGVKSVMANWHKKQYREVGWLRVATSPLLIFVAAAPFVIGGAWLLNAVNYSTGIPASATSWEPQWLATFLSQYNWQPLLLGLIAGRIVHPLFAPVGNTIQLFFVERAVAQSRRTGRVQLWARLPLAPPVVRERYAWLMDRHIKVGTYGRASAVAINVLAVVTGLLSAYGGYIKLWFAKHGVPGNLF
jgi:hypothetical protein